MAVSDAVARVRSAHALLESAVAGLREAYGETLGVRRLVSDVQRLGDDLDEVGDPSPGHRAPNAGEPVEIPDRPYDPSMWLDADDEGCGALHRNIP